MFVPNGMTLREVSLHLRSRLERDTLLADNLRNALGHEIEIDEGWRRIRHLPIGLDQSIAQRHDRNTFEHRARTHSSR